MLYKLEVVVIPVSDVDRAKQFYKALGWREDADFVADEDFRIVQLTPPGSGGSIQFGVGLTPAPPGSLRGMYLVVDDIEAARAELTERGVEFVVVSGDMIEGTITATLLDRLNPGAIAARREEAGKLYNVQEFAAEVTKAVVEPVPADNLRLIGDTSGFVTE